MYNSKQLKPFFDRVHKEASEAAQKVYDKYNKELIQRIKNQMYDGAILYSGMGTAFFENANGEKLDNDLDVLLIDHTQYHNKVSAGFYLPSKIIK